MPKVDRANVLGSGTSKGENWISSKYRNSPNLSPGVGESGGGEKLQADADMLPPSRPPEIEASGIFSPFNVTTASFSRLSTKKLMDFVPEGITPVWLKVGGPPAMSKYSNKTEYAPWSGVKPAEFGKFGPIKLTAGAPKVNPLYTTTVPEPPTVHPGNASAGSAGKVAPPTGVGGIVARSKSKFLKPCPWAFCQRMISVAAIKDSVIFIIVSFINQWIAERLEIGCISCIPCASGE